MSLQPASLATITNTPLALRTLLRGVPDDLIATSPAPQEWSVRHVIAHLVDRHRIQADRIHRVLTEDRPELLDIDESESLAASDLLDRPIDDVLDQFTRERREAVEGYAILGEAELQRAGEHSVAGRVTVADLLNHTAYHDLQHIGQVASILGGFTDRGRGNMRRWQ